jgi:RNA polymerase sigma-70 factor (ECF subfamily)
MAQAITEARLRHWMQTMGPRLIALSTGICHDRHRAEEIVQEAFIKLWNRPPDVGEIAYASWLRRVVTNLSINALKRTKRPSALPEYSADPAMQHRAHPGETDEASDDLAKVRRAMDRLDPAKRAILMLRAAEELSYEEIATHLDVPVGTVMSRLNRARAALRTELERLDDESAGAQSPESFPFRRYLHG